MHQGTIGRDDARRRGPDWVTIVLTWRCPAACAHCGVESSPSNRTRLDRDLARKAVLAAARFSPPPRLSFTGGEPFVEVQALHDLVALARDHGMSSEVVTSAAWVADETRCEATLMRLKAEGLVTLCVSYDRFHEDFIPRWKVGAVVRAGLRVGLKVVLKTIVDPDEPSGEAAFAERLGLTADEIARCVINGQPLSAIGRAADFVDAAAPVVAKPAGGACAFAGRNPTVSPAGKLYPCCGPVMGKLGPAAELFVMADLNDSSVDGIEAALGSGDSDLFTALLNRIGPGGIISTILANDPSIALKGRVDNQCDGCVEMMRNPQLRSKIQDMLHAGAVTV